MEENVVGVLAYIRSCSVLTSTSGEAGPQCISRISVRMMPVDPHAMRNENELTLLMRNDILYFIVKP